MSTLFSGHYLRNRSTLDIGVLGYIGIVQRKEHSPEVLSIPPGTPCICTVLDECDTRNCQLHTINELIPSPSRDLIQRNFLAHGLNFYMACLSEAIGVNLSTGK
jgi:hypothetical protein